MIDPKTGEVLTNDSADSVFDEAGDVEVDPLDSFVSDVGNQLGQLETSLTDVGTTLGTLIGRVDELDVATKNIESHIARGQWMLSEDDLVDFVGWLDETYYLGNELYRWQENTGIVAELTALHIAWKKVSNPKASGAFDALSWHDHLSRTIARLPEHATRKKKFTN